MKSQNIYVTKKKTDLSDFTLKSLQKTKTKKPNNFMKTFAVEL